MNNISVILVKRLLGTASQDELELLESWRTRSDDHDGAARRLADVHLVEGEWRKRQAVNWRRASQQMQERVGGQTASGSLAAKGGRGWLPAMGRRRMMAVAAAAVLLLLTGGVTALMLDRLWGGDGRMALDTEAQARPVLKAGATKAVVTLYGTDAEGVEVTSAEELRAALDRYAAAGQTRQAEDGSGRHAATGSREPAAASLCLTVPRGGEFRIDLEDGTEVWLNAQSRLVYPEAFGGTERRVRVEGEAYFRVAKDEGKPFVVETDGQVVRVTGTEFNVHSYAEDQTVQTTLVSGSVTIAPRQAAVDAGVCGTPSAQGLVLSPGHQAVFDKQAGRIRVKSVDTEVVTSWKDGMFVFEDMTLQDIMLTLSRWYDFEYTFKDKRSAETVFMGRIPRYSDFADVMQIIELSGGLRLRLADRHLTIESTE